MNRSRSCFLIFNTALLTFLLLVFGVAVAFRWLGPRIGGIFEKNFKTVTQNQVVDEESAVIRVVDQGSPSVVSVVVGKISWNPFTGPEKTEGGIGTGFIVGENGIILTNRHVVSDASASYTVVLNNKDEYPVKRVFRDSLNDLAILEIDAIGLKPLALGDSEGLKVGQTVVAIGNALGRFSNTVTTGVVSGIGRGVTASEGLFGPAETLEDVIQTDAALNPGNSGGPLLNLSGEVVGINVAVTQGAQNIGFAIPMNSAKPTLENFQKYGRIVRPYLGVSYVLIGEDIAKLRGLPQGAFIRDVTPNTPAAAAGLMAGDIIIEFDGQAVNEKQLLANLISKRSVGDKVSLKVSRNGKELTLEAKLEEAPAE